MDGFFDDLEQQMRPYLVRSPLDQMEITAASLLVHQQRQQETLESAEEACRQIVQSIDELARYFGIKLPPT